MIKNVKNSMTFFYTENKIFLAGDYGLENNIFHKDFIIDCPELYDISRKMKKRVILARNHMIIIYLLLIL